VLAAPVLWCYVLLPLVYVLVLFGSFFVICMILGGRVLLRNHSVRRFVRSMRQRIRYAEEQGVVALGETQVNRPLKSPRTTAIELQQSRSLLKQSEKAIARGKTDDAERLLIQALTVTPEAHDIRAELAKLYLTSQRYPKAEAMYKELLQCCDDVSFHANLGLACYQQAKYLEAYQSYQEALAHDPKNPERLAALGRASMAVQRYHEAAPLLEQAASRLSRNTQLLHLLAECYLKLGQSEQEEEAYRRINKIEPYNEEVKEKLNTLAQA